MREAVHLLLSFSSSHICGGGGGGGATARGQAATHRQSDTCVQKKYLGVFILYQSDKEARQILP